MLLNKMGAAKLVAVGPGELVKIGVTLVTVTKVKLVVTEVITRPGKFVCTVAGSVVNKVIN